MFSNVLRELTQIYAKMVKSTNLEKVFILIKIWKIQQERLKVKESMVDSLKYS